MRRLLLLSALFSLTVGCGLIGGSEDVQQPDGNGRTPVVTPLPGGGGGGGGSDEGTDEDAPIRADDCDEVEAGEPLPEGEWITGTISCGDSIVGHTAGGGQHFNTKFYEHFYCTPATTKHDGGNERVYRLTVPDGDKTAVVTLDTPCADLDLAAMKYDGTSVPSLGSGIDRCEMNQKTGLKKESVKLVSKSTTTWTIVVEGKAGEEAPFALSVECHDGLN